MCYRPIVIGWKIINIIELLHRVSHKSNINLKEYQIIYSSSPIHLMARAETIMNSKHQNPKSQSCGRTVTTFPSWVTGKLVDLKHEEIATSVTN